MNKKELMQKIKKEVVWYAQPRNMHSRSKEELLKMYGEAKEFNLTKGDKK